MNYDFFSAEVLRVPLLTVQFRYFEPGSFSVNLAPSSLSLGSGISSLLSGDLDTLVFYEDWSDLLSLENLFRETSGRRSTEFIKLSDMPSTPDLEEKRVNIVLASCNKEEGLEFLETLLVRGLLGRRKRIILPCLHFDISHLKRFHSLGAEIVLLSLDTEEKYNLEYMMLVDGLDILSKSLASLNMAGQLTHPQPRTCTNSTGWEDGYKILEKMRGTSFLGESGMVSLDETGVRSSFSLKVSETQFGKIVANGIWTPQSGYLRSKEIEISEFFSPNTEKIEGRLVVATILSSPYTMTPMTNQGEKSPSYEGFAIDLINEISSIVGFNYTLNVVSGYGSENPDGSWNGMIGEILEGQADLAIADLTINYQREKVVDFSMPFLDLGISILFVSSPSKSINIFSFITPLSGEVWILTLVGGISVSLTLFLIARVSPLETAELDSSEGVSPFLSLRHCFWFSASSWVQQGCDFLPRAFSTRTVASFWWFFTLIMISSYTANLAAFLTIERMDSPISSVQDLAKSDLKYGSIESGSTLSFFSESDSPVYKKMWSKMQSWGDSLVKSNQEGIDKVLLENGGYAFFMESTSIEYQIERNCKLTKVGGNLDSKSYGVAMRKGSHLRSRISSAIIRLRQDGVLERLKEKWWREERGGGLCLEEESSGGVSKLTLHNLGGIFLVLLLGLVLGSIVALLEVIWVFCKKRNLLI